MARKACSGHVLQQPTATLYSCRTFREGALLTAAQTAPNGLLPPVTRHSPLETPQGHSSFVHATRMSGAQANEAASTSAVLVVARPLHQRPASIHARPLALPHKNSTGSSNRVPPDFHHQLLNRKPTAPISGLTCPSWTQPPRTAPRSRPPPRLLLLPLLPPRPRPAYMIFALLKSISGCAAMNFLSISCFCISSEVGSPIAFCRWSNCRGRQGGWEGCRFRSGGRCTGGTRACDRVGQRQRQQLGIMHRRWVQGPRGRGRSGCGPCDHRCGVRHESAFPRSRHRDGVHRARPTGVPVRFPCFPSCTQTHPHTALCPCSQRVQPSPFAYLSALGIPRLWPH